MKVSVFGLGKLGAPMVALFASRGHDVIGVDNNLGLLDELRHGGCSIQETGLRDLLASVSVRFTSDYSEAAGNSDISFIMVPTPSNDIGAFKSDYVLQVVRNIGRCLNRYHLIVVTSTVMPGAMENEIKPTLEELGKRCGHDFGLCYNPEFIALGSVIRDMSNPDAILIGESDKKAGDILEAFLRTIVRNSPKICRMSWWNAEFAKIALNAFLTTKVNLANTYAMICDVMPTGDIDAVTDFLGQDTRIIAKFLKGGLSAGGTCLPRDNEAFAVFAKGLGIPTPIQQASAEVNNIIDTYAIKCATELLMDNKTVSILGLTYKPNTPVVEKSASIVIARALAKKYKVRVYDPMGMENAKRELGNLVEYTRDVAYCLHQSDLCVIATPWPIFGALTYHDFLDFMRTPGVFDCWRMLDGEVLKEHGVKYHALGVNNVG